MPFVVAHRGRVAVVPTDGTLVVGRHRECALRVGEADATTSRRHAAFRTRGDACECRDLGSAHGTTMRRGARVVDVGETWTRVCGEDDENEATLTLGKGGTTATVRFAADFEASETDRDEDDESETERAGAETMVTECGEMIRVARRREVGVETLGEAETVIAAPTARRGGDASAKRDATGATGGANFKRFKKQVVVGVHDAHDGARAMSSGVTSPRRRAPEAYASVYEQPEIVEDREVRERAEAAEAEAEKLFEIGLPGDKKAAARKRATAKNT